MTQAFTPAILIHVGAAVGALTLGTAMFLRRKGTFSHRIAGRVWGALMLVTAISTYWIRSDGGFSWIHLLSILTVLMLVRGVAYAIQHNPRGHQLTMQGLFYGALVIAGAFSFMPQRLLGQMLWSALGLV